ALPHTGKPEVPAPKGFFDDLPARPARKTDDIAPKGFFDDLPQRARSSSGHPGATGDGDLQLDAGHDLDLMAQPGGDAAFDNVELSTPVAPSPAGRAANPS